MTIKRQIIKNICKADGLDKYQTKEVLRHGRLVINEAYSGSFKDHKKRKEQRVAELMGEA